MLTAQDAVDALYRIAVTENRPTSGKRLDALADLCVQELTRRGLTGVAKEVEVPGVGRSKRWDVAWGYDGKVRLGLSLKSLLKNLGGTVPNRIDDLIGEAANAQLHSPEIALGYVMVFNVARDRYSPKHGSTWFELFRKRLNILSGRRLPSWTTGTLEDFLLMEVDFRAGPDIRSVSQPFDRFFDNLVEQIRIRNPGALPPKERHDPAEAE